jgi:type IX secretion system PorP/SprF family membrane protein
MVACCILSFSLSAQDPAFTQFYTNRIYLNPALTGLEPGLTLTGISRVQWFRADQGFRTFAVSAELQEDFLNSGFGLHLMQDNQGHVNLATTSVGLSYSYIIPGPVHNFHFGLHARWSQRRIDWDKIVFSDQLDPLLGAIFPTAAIPRNDRTSFWDVDFGFAWRFNVKPRNKGNRISSSRYILGFNLTHLPSLFGSNQANESFQGLESIVPPRLTVHAGGIIPITFLSNARHDFRISPNFRFDIQGENLLNFDKSLQVFTLGAYVLYNQLYGGVFYQDRLPVPNSVRHTNSIILMAGMAVEFGQGREPQTFFFGFSVDINSTGLGVEGGNIYELALRYNLPAAVSMKSKKRRTSGKRILDCKSFY